MPSRVSSARRKIEDFLRAVALIALVWLFWRAIRPTNADTVELANSNTIGDLLRRWSTTRAPTRVHVVFDSTPGSPIRHWLEALGRAGTGTGWSGERLIPAGIAVEPIPDPRGGVRVLVAAPDKTPVVLEDAAGLIDTLEAKGGGGMFNVEWATGAIQAVAGGTAARGVLRDSLVFRPVLVIGRPSWETKFILMALEERGWKVTSFVSLSPDANITQNKPASPDTAVYSAVIAVDSAAVRYADKIVNYVKAGGGLIIAGDAVEIPALKPLLSGSPGKLVAAPSAALVADSTTKRPIALIPVVDLKKDAVALERRNDTVAVAARRVGRGRVAQVGYDGTWEWRMTGTDSSLLVHREWWSRAVSAVAYTPRIERPSTLSIDPAPLASLVESFGPAVPKPSGAVPEPENYRTEWILFTVLAAATLIEVGSRRLRGAS